MFARMRSGRAEKHEERRVTSRNHGGALGAPSDKPATSRADSNERYDPDIAIREIVDNLTITRDKVIAWYLLAPQPWSFRSDRQREGVIVDGAMRLAKLSGRRLHLRRTSRPYPVRAWAEALDRNTPYPLPGVRGNEWSDFVVAEQMHLQGRSLADPETYLGIQLSRRSSMNKLLHRAAQSKLFGRMLGDAADSELAALDRELAELDSIMAGPGLEAVPCTPEQMEWLLHRSCSLGMPAPLTSGGIGAAQWHPEDVAEFTDRVHWYAEPYDQTVTVVGEHEGRQLTRYVAVLTFGRMGELDIPGGTEPYLQKADRLPFPIEWSATFDVLDGRLITGEMQRQMQRISSQKRHYENEHGMKAPLSLDRQASRALEIEDEMQSGFDGLATRVHGWWRAAVSGRTREEALERARQVTDLYAPSITVVQPYDQYRMAREFIAGEPVANGAHKRRMSVVTAAAGVPAATAAVGDRRGVHIGETCTASRRPVMWDPWYAMEVREKSGLTPIVGDLGSGKSTLVGQIVYKTVRQRVSWVILDPSGPLARLCALPEIAHHSRAINLLNAAPGSLNPYRVVAEPRFEHFLDERDPEKAWHKARILAAATRRSLATDILRQWMPPEIADDRATRVALLKAVRAVGGQPENHPGMVIEALRHLGDGLSEAAQAAAEFLDAAREMPQAQLVLPEARELGAADEVARADSEFYLTVLTMPGLVLPLDGSDRRDWTDEERFSFPLLHLASWLTQRSIYERDRHERKGVAFDETWVLTQLSSGRALSNRTARDTRKFNTRALWASQNGGDHLAAGIGNLIGASFIGRTTEAEAQGDALRMAKIECGVGYEETLAKLSPQARRAEGRSGFREFVFADGDGGVEKIRIDIEAHQHLKAALDTTADPSKVRRAARPQVTEDDVDEIEVLA
jgi:hypothetical protein